MYLFAFIVGILSQKIVFLPIFIIFILCPSRRVLIRCIFCILIGYGWSVWHESRYVDKNCPIGLVKMQGIVKSFSQRKGSDQQWQMQILNSKTKIWVHCQNNCPQMFPGETWQLTGRLWKKDMLNNPGNMNFWYQEANKHISGHLQLQKAKLKQGIAYFDLMAKFRRFLYLKAYSHISDEFSRSLFLTLVLGMGSELSTDDWQIFKDTGIAHLMVVSGAHLSLLMSMVSFVVNLLARYHPRMIEKIPILRLSSWVGLLMGFLYAWLCGFGIPVQRAWIMAFLGSYHLWRARRFGSWESWMYALWIVVILEPHAICNPGFYLSFGSVGVFIWIANSAVQKKWHKYMLSQLMCIVVLSPLSILWFQNIAISGFMVNFIAIPWVSWITLPMSIACALTWSSQLVALFEWTNTYLHQGLSFLHQLKVLNWQGTWMDYRLPWLWLLMGILMIVLPIQRLRLVMLFFAFIMSFPHLLRLQKGEYLADFLDVGQGLAIVIRTQHHQLIFDTGGAGQHWTMAEKVILPYFHHQQIKQLNKMIVSHPDLDHRGGLMVLKDKFPSAEIIVDDPTYYHFGKSCHQMKKWQWDGVDFQFLTARVKHVSRNNHSCVLRVNNHNYQLLLTGDIEKAMESSLRQAAIRSTVLQVPHHGSLTSSTQTFLAKVRPQLAVVSVALHNRYRLPNVKVLQRYQNLGISWISTADFGMIRVIFKNNKWNIWRWKLNQRLQIVF